MSEEVGISNYTAQQNQKRNMIVLLILMTVLTVGFSLYIVVKAKVKQKTVHSGSETINVSAIGEDIEDGSIALQRLEKKIRDYEDKLKDQGSENEGAGEEESREQNRLLLDLQEKIEVLERRLEEMPSGNEGSALFAEEEKTLPSASFPSMQGYEQKISAVSAFSEEKSVSSGIQVDSFQSDKKPKTAANYIAAGTYVKALLIQGVDASASVSSQTDPRPVLMRLVSNGSLPNEVSTHVEDCRLIGAAYGDISSERAFMRLESMSCTLKSKSIVESVVDGYVVGEDGKEGVRGVVVRREMDLLTNSFLSGLASGLGAGLSESFDSDLISPLGVVRETKSADVFKKAGATGVNNSFERLSKYYIDRAEQFQPVIQISAGREIDVVFKKGFYFHEGTQPIVLAQDE